jgi:hypothetical protein
MDMKLAPDVAFLMCGLQHDRKDVYEAKQMRPCAQAAAAHPLMRAIKIDANARTAALR